MASHWSTIGLSVQSGDDLAGLANRVAQDCTPHEVEGGAYQCWSSASGVELWLQIDADNQLIGLLPHFRGKSAVRVGLTARLIEDRVTEMDGAFHCWSEPANDDPESGCYPFVFDTPDFLCHAGLELPTVAQVQIGAFAHEVESYPSEQAYGESQTGEVKFASRSFIPSGLFSPDGDRTEPPQAMAIFTGHVIDAGVRKNELTSKRFYWALVETLGGAFDVVISPELLRAPPKTGNILSGSFWLSGRILWERGQALSGAI
jgi:hypothetical protein